LNVFVEKGKNTMQTLGFTGRLAAAAARRPWTTIGVWAVVLAAAFVLAGRLGDVVTEEQTLEVATESQQGWELIESRLTGDGPAQEFVLVESAGPDFSAPAFTEEVGRLTADLRSVDHVAAAVSALDGVPGLVSADGRTALIVVTIDEAADGMVVAEAITGVLDAGPGFRVTVVGEGSVNNEFQALAEETLLRGEMFGIGIALVILVLVFGAAVAAGVPLLLAGLSIVLALRLTAIAGRVVEISMFATNMITMIGLAVGIDYTLFIVQRYREERRRGRRVTAAVALAGNSATRAVFFSGVTVVIALTGLLVLPDTVMRSLGTGAILVVLSSLAAALTLLPAVLRLLGDRVDRGRLPFSRRSTDREGGGRFWQRVTTAVTARPVLSVVLATAVLLTAAIPFLTIRTGQNFISSLPEDSGSRHAFTVLGEQFDTGVITTPIVVDARADDPAVEAAVAGLTAELAARPEYGDVAVRVAPGGDLLVLEAVSKLDPSSAEGEAALRELRAEVIPAAFAGTDVPVYVTGDAAFIADYSDVLSARTPFIVAFVLGLSFVLLMIVFRSIVVPLKAIVMNLLSVGAAYGLLVLVFQHGVGAGILGLQQTEVIEAWIPIFLFAVLFGLSMDYHIFLLSRIKEHYDETGDNLGSVAFGLGSTGAIITGAALIMVAVFGGFAAGDLAMFQQMGFGLGVAVILDATIVRSVLVPAAMALLGDRNWYLPAWLRWLPQIHIEGRPAAVPPMVPEKAAA
jgi:RND superfamily putative drug exporter